MVAPGGDCHRFFHPKLRGTGRDRRKNDLGMQAHSSETVNSNVTIDLVIVEFGFGVEGTYASMPMDVVPMVG